VKIDQRFVHGLEKNKNDEAITAGDHRALALAWTALASPEGVETPSQFNFLKAHGCEEAQGYLIAHPLSEADLRSWWRIQQELHQGADRQADLWQKGD
jgi:EAL domain-containing protein (putative c-di-GMP-specific phosphodiesterase class I)